MADVAGSVAIDGGTGNDKILIAAMFIAPATATGNGGTVNVAGGDGSDNIDLRFINLPPSTLSGTPSSINVDAGANDDKLSISDSNADAFFAALGGGQDTLTASGTLAFKNTIHVTGGSDKDTLNGKTALTANPTASLLLDLEKINS
jgi:hypothetical protein